jgi:hypothetical protein
MRRMTRRCRPATGSIIRIASAPASRSGPALFGAFGAGRRHPRLHSSGKHVDYLPATSREVWEDKGLLRAAA